MGRLSAAGLLLLTTLNLAAGQFYESGHFDRVTKITSERVFDKLIKGEFSKMSPPSSPPFPLMDSMGSHGGGKHGAISRRRQAWSQGKFRCGL